MHRICVVGTGYVGLPLSALLSKSFPVVGFDVDREKIALLASGQVPLQEPGLKDLLVQQLATGNLRFTHRPEEISDCDVKILTVGTPYDAETGSVDYSQFDRALSLIGPHLRPGDVLIVKSTVPPGTTGHRVRAAVESRGLRVPDEVGLTFSPERIVEGQALLDFSNLPKIIGSTDDTSYEVAREVLGSLGGSVTRVSGPEVAEMVKMVDNYSRYVFLGLTNEIALMCEKVGVDVLELIEAAKFEYPRNAGILRPGPGVGGSCLNKDPLILAALMEKDGLTLRMVESAARINRLIPLHVVDLVDRFARSRRNVVIAGVAFKKDTDDLRFSPVFEMRDELKRRGYAVRLSDPYARPDGLDLEQDLLSAAKGADILLVLTDHTVYRDLDLVALKEAMAPGPLIVDARGQFDPEQARKCGFEYHGYGRL